MATQLNDSYELSPDSGSLEIVSCSSWQERSTRTQFAPCPKDNDPLPFCPSVPTLPHVTSVCVSDLSRQGSQAQMCVADVPTQTPLDIPSWWACAGPEGLTVAVPLAVLVAAAGCWFAIGGLTTTSWYAALYVALSLAMLFLVLLYFAFTTQRLLRRLSHSLAAVLAAEHDQVADTLAVDRRIRFLQRLLRTDGVEAVAPRDPLDFLQAELLAMPTGPEGYIIINTTGIILWANEALLHYFGYTADELLQENVRVLMPKPYSVQHDYFMRKHVETGRCCVLGKSREVPVMDKSGIQSVVMMGLDDRIDPSDAASRVFLARMNFNSEDVLLQAARMKVDSPCAVPEALKVLEGMTEAVVSTNAQGIILFANRAAYNLFEWPDEQLVGENVRVLMAEPFASAHDGFLHAYQLRAENAQLQGSWPASHIVGSGRDVMAKAKSGKRVRVFIMVTRMDRPSGNPKECVFVSKMVHIKGEAEDKSTGNQASGPRRASLVTVSQAPLDRDTVAIRFLPRRCTVVGIVVEGLGVSTDREALHRDFSILLGLVTDLCSVHRGLLNWVVGTQLYVAFNLAALPNMCHCNSAATFMLQLMHEFASVPLAQRYTLRVAGVSVDGFSGQWGSHQQVTGNPLHCAQVFLSAQRESRVRKPVIDGMLFGELQYNFSCRPVNRAVVSESGAAPKVLDVYELMSVHETSADEWMYELPPAANQPRDNWSLAWIHLPAAAETTLLSPRPKAPRSSLAEACRFLQLHLDDKPSDATALWLLDLLQQRCQQPVPAPRQRPQQCGPLMYRLQFDSAAGVCDCPPMTRPCWNDKVAVTKANP
eukprot:GGOE01032318.1.p1 GENE.GGOE01032318.1~~GGOE01032318.1.p1  ORF type:complete len:820 (-),score=214.70 GGOE01032318.1:2463-4922(-)